MSERKTPGSLATFIYDASQTDPVITSGVERFLTEPTSFTSPTLRRVATHVQIAIAVLETLPNSRILPKDRQRMKVHLLNADLYHFPLPFGLNVGFGQLGLDSGVVFDRHKATSEYQDFYYAYRHRHEEVTRLVQKGTPLTKALKEVPWPEDVGKSKSADSSAKRLHELLISQACQAFYERQREREAAEKFIKSPIDYPAYTHRRPQFRFV